MIATLAVIVGASFSSLDAQKTSGDNAKM